MEEMIEKGTLFFLWNLGQDTFSGYGLTVEPDQKDHLVGLLMVDRPRPVDPNWLAAVEHAFGAYSLTAMTATGERGIACQMWIEARSLSYLRQIHTPKSAAVEEALKPLLDALPGVHLALRWDAERRLWRSRLVRISQRERETIAQERPAQEPLFPLGQVVATPGAMQALDEAEQTPLEFLRRHVRGDWGLVPDEDKKENEYSLRHGLRLFSSYRTNNGTKIWVITEHDRSVTTLLLPGDY